MALAPESAIQPFADRHGLKDVIWLDLSEWGSLVGFANGTSRYVEQALPLPRRSPLKKRYRP